MEIERIERFVGYMSSHSPGQYFLSKGIAPHDLANRLETLPTLEREVILARAASTSLRQIAKRIGLTPEGVRYLEGQAINKLRNQPTKQKAEGEELRQVLEQRLGIPLDSLLEELPRQEREILLWYANGFPLAELAPALGLSLGEVVQMRDEVIARISNQHKGATTDEWAELKATVVRTLAKQSLTYTDLDALLRISRTRTRKLMGELVKEGKAEVSDELPLRFYAPGALGQD